MPVGVWWTELPHKSAEEMKTEKRCGIDDKVYLCIRFIL